MTVQFTVLGKIKGKARPRMTKAGHTYTPSDTVTYEKAVQLMYKNQCKGIFFGDKQPIGIYIKAMFAIPKSYTKAKKELIQRGELLPTKKPDADNIAKIICDALNGIAYEDDVQIVNMYVDKVYTSGKERVDVWIRDIGGTK